MSKLFTSEELEALYQIVKEYQENAPENEDETYNDYYDEYEEVISKKVIPSILKKVAQQLPTETKEEINKDFLRQKYHTYNNPINGNAYSVLKSALEQLRTVEISYFNMDSADFKKRKIDVYYTSARYILKVRIIRTFCSHFYIYQCDLISSKTNHIEYTIGYCHLRKEMRKFRTSRIASTKLTDEVYTIPKNFNKNDY